MGILHTAINNLRGFLCHAIPKSAFLFATSQRQIRLLGVSGKKGTKRVADRGQTHTANNKAGTFFSKILNTARDDDDDGYEIGGGWEKPVPVRVADRGNASHGKQQAPNRFHPVTAKIRIHPRDEQKRQKRKLRVRSETLTQEGRMPCKCFTRQTTFSERIPPRHHKNPHSS